MCPRFEGHLSWDTTRVMLIFIDVRYDSLLYIDEGSVVASAMILIGKTVAGIGTKDFVSVKVL